MIWSRWGSLTQADMKLKAGAADVDAETAKVRADFALRAGQPKKESAQKGKKGASNSRMGDQVWLFDTLCASVRYCMYNIHFAYNFVSMSSYFSLYTYYG